MKITKKQLKTMIKEELLKEFQTTKGATAATKRAVQKTADIKSKEKTAAAKRHTTSLSAKKLANLSSLLKTAKYNVTKSLKLQPDPRTQTSKVTDTSKWIHPYSKATAAVKPKTGQPKSGWAYDTQTQRTDRFIHPYSGKGVINDPKVIKKPTTAWQVTEPPKKVGGVAKVVDFGHGSKSDYENVKLKKGWKKSDPKEIPYEYGKAVKTYSQGGQGDYQIVDKQAKAGKGTWETLPLMPGDPKRRHSNLTKALPTTNPTKDVTSDRPEWTDWNVKHQGFVQGQSDAQSDYDSGYSDWEGHQGEEDTAEDELGGSGWGTPPPGDPPVDDASGGWAGGGGGGGRGGGGGGGGRGRGRGRAGKGKGKGKKKKDESLFKILGRDLMNEINDIKSSLKNQKKLHKK
jgi:hypothetical protein